MKALWVSLASAALAGCVGYGPGGYEPAYSAYPAYPIYPLAAYGGPYHGPFLVDPPAYYYDGPVAPYGYGYGWGGYGWGGYGHPGYQPHGPRPRRGERPSERPARTDPVLTEGGGSGWSPADIRGGGGGAGTPVGGGSGWSPGQR